MDMGGHMKAIIFTLSIGGGHNSVALAIKERLDMRKDICEIVDLCSLIDDNRFSFIAQNVLKPDKSGYQTYDLIYDLSRNRLFSMLFNLYISSFNCNNIRDKIIKSDSDIVIATHPYAVQLVTKLKRLRKIRLPLISVVTDYIATYTYTSSEVDHYIVASDYTKGDLMNLGIYQNKISACGIPIRKKFYNKNHIASKDLRIMLMSGMCGCLSMKDMAYDIIKNTNARLKVIAGGDKQLIKTLQNGFKEEIASSRLEIYEYVKNIDELMDNSDLLITKPGGISITEAIIKNLPMIIPFRSSGQERYNAKFLEENHLAIVLDNKENLASVINKLDMDELKSKRKRLMQFSNQLDEDKAIDIIVSLANKKEGIYPSLQSI